MCGLTFGTCAHFGSSSSTVGKVRSFHLLMRVIPYHEDICVKAA